MLRIVLLVLLFGGVCFAERTQRLDFVIHAPDVPEEAWLFITPDRIDLLQPNVLGSLVTDRGHRFGGSSTLQQVIDGCLRTADTSVAAVRYCNLDYRNLQPYPFFPFPDLGRRVGDAVGPISAATWSVATSYKPQPDAPAYLLYGENAPDYLPMSFVGFELFDIPGDITHDGSVDALDASLLFSRWGLPDKYFGQVTTDAASAGQLFAEWTGDVLPVPEPAYTVVSLLVAIGYRRRLIGPCDR